MNDGRGLSPGTVVGGRWRIARVLGAGGFGVTYEAVEAASGERVALKEYLPRGMCTRDPATQRVIMLPDTDERHYRGGLESFLKEARALERLSHRSIVGMVERLEANGTAYMALEFIDGETLKDWFERLGRRLTQAELDALLWPILSALIQVHSIQALHRDIKPENIMMRADGTPVLIDFGAVKALQSSDTHGRGGATLGFFTPGYAAPEQFVRDGERLLGPWTDIYAVGAMLYRLLTGRAPPQGDIRQLEDSYVALATMPRTHGAPGEVRPWNHLEPAWRPEFLATIDRALEVRRSERPQSAVEFRRALGVPEPVRQGGVEALPPRHRAIPARPAASPPARPEEPLVGAPVDRVRATSADPSTDPKRVMLQSPLAEPPVQRLIPPPAELTTPPPGQVLSLQEVEQRRAREAQLARDHDIAQRRAGFDNLPARSGARAVQPQRRGALLSKVGVGLIAFGVLLAVLAVARAGLGFDPIGNLFKGVPPPAPTKTELPKPTPTQAPRPEQPTPATPAPSLPGTPREKPTNGQPSAPDLSPKPASPAEAPRAPRAQVPNPQPTEPTKTSPAQPPAPPAQPPLPQPAPPKTTQPQPPTVTPGEAPSDGRPAMPDVAPRPQGPRTQVPNPPSAPPQARQPNAERPVVLDPLPGPIKPVAPQPDVPTDKSGALPGTPKPPRALTPEEQRERARIEEQRLREEFQRRQEAIRERERFERERAGLPGAPQKRPAPAQPDVPPDRAGEPPALPDDRRRFEAPRDQLRKDLPVPPRSEQPQGAVPTENPVDPFRFLKAERASLLVRIKDLDERIAKLDIGKRSKAIECEEKGLDCRAEGIVTSGRPGCSAKCAAAKSELERDRLLANQYSSERTTLRSRAEQIGLQYVFQQPLCSLSKDLQGCYELCRRYDDPGRRTTHDLCRLACNQQCH